MLMECEEVLSVGQWAEVRAKPGMLGPLKNQLTLRATEMAGGGIYPQYKEHPAGGNLLYIPRALADGCKVIGDWEKLGATSKLVPRPGQGEVITKFMNKLRQWPYGGIIQSSTGTGKTVMALDIACKIGLTTLIIVPRTTLMKQWKDQILKWTDAKPEDIGEVQGPDFNVSGKKFVVAMIHTLTQHRDRYDESFTSWPGLVVVDECHVISSETFSKVAPLFNCKVRLGLSATPVRKDGLARIFYWHLGPILAKFEKLQAAPRFRLVDYNGQDTSSTGCVWAGKLNLGRYFNRVAASEPRLQLVAKLIYSLSVKGEDILVLSDRIVHLENLKKVLTQKGADPTQIGFLTGKIKQLDKKIILGTYGAAGMGVDIPRLTALVLATPRADIIQPIGRVLRQGSPIIIDIVDTASQIMAGWSRHRIRHYATITQDIKRIKV